jgi:putative ABC transport system permease protein
MNLWPILSSLRRHRTAALLIIGEIALSCAIVCNAIFLIGDRLARLDAPSGVAEAELVRVALAGIGAPDGAAAITAQDLAALRAIPGVRAAAAANMVPFGGSSWNNGVGTDADERAPRVNAAMYAGSPGLVETLGVRLVAGRGLTADEYVPLDGMLSGSAVAPSILITRALAERLYPGASPLGKLLYVWGPHPQTVVGVIEQLARPSDANGPASRDYAMILPILMPYTIGGSYLLRVDPARRAEVLAAADRALRAVSPSRVILSRKTFTEIRDDHFRGDRAMALLLGGVCLALLIVTAVGVVGLASFWVQQRTRQIGVRRALGATRGDIVRYFQLENFVLATAGIAVGMALAYAINHWLMGTYEVARLPASYLPVGAVILWALGQLAVLGPAVRAARIPPAIATRSV